KVEQDVAMRIGMKMLVGLVDSIVTRSAMMERGMTDRPEALSTRNMICALDAVSLFGLSSCRSFIAFNPRGVAALSRPRMLALKFMTMEPVAGWLRGISGKRREKNGLNRRARIAI